MNRQLAVPNCDGTFEICWDDLGIPHVYASTVADAFRGMGYVEGHERLWQIHLSCLYANGNAAEVMGERFVRQDVLHRAFDVPAGRLGVPDSEGDPIVDAYLDGLNACVAALDEVPPEFAGIDAEPRPFTRTDIASRYRFTSWFQARSWPEKMFLGRTMARHGIERFRGHAPRFSEHDAEEVRRLDRPLKELDLTPIALVNIGAKVGPQANAPSGSNNWAVTGTRTASGKPMLATDPHQPHSIPNTFFYVHLHAPGWDVFGASFPGVPYFMMGYTRDVAWGLTTGMIDNYDVYVEEVDGDRIRTPDGWQPIQTRTESIAVRGGQNLDFEVACGPHGPLLEPLTHQLGMREAPEGRYRTSVRWALGRHATSAGTLARLPLATTTEEFGETLFEGDISPLVNNIIAVDRHDSLRRFIVATFPKRKDVTGVVPLAGWDARWDFEETTARELTVEVDPPSGFSVTANNDTLGEDFPFPVHTFAAASARADRVGQLVGDRTGLTAADFEAMQADLKDLRAEALVPELLPFLADTGDARLELLHTSLAAWDLCADPDSAAAAIYYTFLDRMWHCRFLVESVGEDFVAQPLAAPNLNKVEPSRYPAPLWDVGEVGRAIRRTFLQVHEALQKQFGDPSHWRFGDMHQICFWHTLSKRERWQAMQVGPEPLGGSPTTLAMAVHMGKGPGREPGADRVPQRVFHGPAFRLVVDLADPDHCRFVIASGNSGRPGSKHVTDHFPTWLKGEHHTVSLLRDELRIEQTWQVE